MLQKMLLVAAVAVFLSHFAAMYQASAYERVPQKPAIVLAAFGTTEVEAVHSILNIMERVEKAFPEYDVHLVFTSSIIRNIWHRRANDAAFRAENTDIPEKIYGVRNILSTLAGIQEGGTRLILVQSLHVTDGEEYKDMTNLIKALAEYETQKPARKPFPWIAVGDPALGVGDGKDQYLERAAEALAPLARKAWETGSALVLMGHGNEHFPQEVYGRLESVMRKKYGPQVYIGTVEVAPFPEDIVEAIAGSENAPKTIFLAPLMVVAGDHARNDMAGDEEDSWLSIFEAAGYEVDVHLVGLGSNESWADIYVEHLKAIETPLLEKKAKDEAEEE